ncbi:hypothetical protein FE394_12070 [Xenorhabdus sp. Reich]|uniref:Uncharacterized protein n=2 Tax=Xenorhabdus littoralis TaxID=2582835 RepID=A0ABU4SMQ4_9GAMM|nr:hypothetical protein [Xenorhabdus sp. Reich]MDX7999922.1 hypothetical protein [Xenorhabdus sp. Reich]
MTLTLRQWRAGDDIFSLLPMECRLRFKRDGELSFLVKAANLRPLRHLAYILSAWILIVCKGLAIVIKQSHNSAHLIFLFIENVLLINRLQVLS